MILLNRWEPIPSRIIHNIMAWNVRGLNKKHKQVAVAQCLTSHHVSLFGLLETKINSKDLASVYQNICPSWCFSHNMSQGRIIIG